MEESCLHIPNNCSNYKNILTKNEEDISASRYTFKRNPTGENKVKRPKAKKKGNDSIYIYRDIPIPHSVKDHSAYILSENVKEPHKKKLEVLLVKPYLQK